MDNVTRTSLHIDKREQNTLSSLGLVAQHVKKKDAKQLLLKSPILSCAKFRESKENIDRGFK